MTSVTVERVAKAARSTINVGDRYGRLTVLERVPRPGDKHFLCRCDCGTEKVIRGASLRARPPKGTQSCGCLRDERLAQWHESCRVDLTGERFGKLEVLRISDRKGGKSGRWWLCVCDCGNLTEVVSGELLREQMAGHRRGHRKGTKSCGQCSLVGQRFGPVVVVEFDHSEPRKGQSWVCQCDCGNEVVLRTRELRTPNTGRNRSNSGRVYCGRDCLFHHKLSELDPEARTAVCSVCGPTDLWRRSGKGWVCQAQYPVCEIEDCEQRSPYKANGEALCWTHYARWQRWGDARATSRPCPECGLRPVYPDHDGACYVCNRHKMVRPASGNPNYSRPKFPELADREWLAQQLAIKTSQEVADVLGCGPGLVTRWRLRHQLPRGSAQPRYTRVMHLLTRELLLVEYIDKRRSTTDIAADFGCSGKAVGDALMRHGIPIRSQRTYGPLLTVEFLKVEYVEKGRTVASIAADVGCSGQTVRVKLHSYDMMRSRGEASRLASRQRTHPPRDPYSGQWISSSG